MTTPLYTWWGWEAETELDNDDDRANVWSLTIIEDGEEMATIVHRICPDEDGTPKFPLDGPVAQAKVERAERIVAALNQAVAS